MYCTLLFAARMQLLFSQQIFYTFFKTFIWSQKHSNTMLLFKSNTHFNTEYWFFQVIWAKHVLIQKGYVRFFFFFKTSHPIESIRRIGSQARTECIAFFLYIFLFHCCPIWPVDLVNEQREVWNSGLLQPNVDRYWDSLSGESNESKHAQTDSLKESNQRKESQ